MKIEEVINKNYCVGCGLCVSVAGEDKLQMKMNTDGFLIPQPVNGFDGEISELRNFCPGVTVRLRKPLRNSYEKMYGPFQDLKVAYAMDPEIRFRGSSGGLLTALLCGLIEQGKIDGVLQAGAGHDAPILTQSYFSRTVAEVIRNAGSRYAPSSLLCDFKQILDDNSRVAVVGKPCDIVAVCQFLDLHPEYKKKVYCTLSFMCMGLPSHNATLQLIEQLGVDDVREVNELGYRGRGWPGRAFVETAEGKKSCSYMESWRDILGRDVLFRCKICPDGWGGFADVSSGDAWYSDGNGPVFDEELGRSFLFVRTGRGAEVVDACSAYIDCADYNINELPAIQISQHARKERIWIAYALIKLLGDHLLCFKGLGVWSQMFKNSPRSIVREIRGILKRLPK